MEIVQGKIIVEHFSGNIFEIFAIFLTEDENTNEKNKKLTNFVLKFHMIFTNTHSVRPETF